MLFCGTIRFRARRLANAGLYDSCGEPLPPQVTRSCRRGLTENITTEHRSSSARTSASLPDQTKKKNTHVDYYACNHGFTKCPKKIITMQRSSQQHSHPFAWRRARSYLQLPNCAPALRGLPLQVGQLGAGPVRLGQRQLGLSRTTTKRNRRRQD